MIRRFSFLCAWPAPAAALFVALFAAFPLSAHEGHDHGAEVKPADVRLAPRFAVRGETLEIVGVLAGQDLLLYVDRADDNAPVAGAAIEIEGPGLKGVATAAGKGIYRFPAKSLAQPGKHPLTLTVQTDETLDLLAASLEVPAAASASARLPVAEAAAGVEPARRLADGSLIVPKSLQRQLALRTEAARRGEFPRTVELNGRIVADPNAGGRVQVFQGGRIEAGPKGLAVLGQRVRKGEVLAWLQPAARAGERASQQAALAELAAQESVLDRRLVRLRQLEGSVPQKDIEQAEIELAAFAKRRAAVAGGLEREALTAPVSGVVAAANAVVGQVVEARETVFEVVDPQRLAVEALAYEPIPADGLLRASAPVPGGVLDLVFVGAGRSLKEQALPVLFRVGVPKGARPGTLPALAVGQSLKVLAQTRARQSGVAVPAAAVVRNAANEAVVWVHEGPERFVARRIKTSPLDGRSLLAGEGLAGGERVVAQGAVSLAQIR